MKIRITTTVEVDANAWAYEYGIPKQYVREDVRSYFATWLQDHIKTLGLEVVTDADN